jgi:hypothetical protein
MIVKGFFIPHIFYPIKYHLNLKSILTPLNATRTGLDKKEYYPTRIKPKSFPGGI